ncbi:hypothetical protein [Methylobacterium sp. GC_Met_2]|uniref:hypothetical protein n=1 Tax=Methylobacterium sp. GC_Met_2 TaxID=2937376 RepID=UPI00226B8CF6|nr:hypothetical protein [Methylobacterium sp. GC_Met_2]
MLTYLRDGEPAVMSDAEAADFARRQAAAVQGQPAPNTQLTFLALFSPAEQAAIVTSADAQIRLFCLMAAGSTFVSLADPRVVAGAQMLESAGLIAAGRAAQVLAGQAPASS